MRLGTRGKDRLWCPALRLHPIPLSPLWPRASQSKLRCSQVVPTVQPSNTATNTPNNGIITRNRCHRIENTSLFALQCLFLYKWGISTGKLKIYTIDDSKYCTKSECNSMITAPIRHNHPSSGAHRLSDVAVGVNVNAEGNLMAVNAIIECFQGIVLSGFRV